MIYFVTSLFPYVSQSGYRFLGIHVDPSYVVLFLKWKTQSAMFMNFINAFDDSFIITVINLFAIDQIYRMIQIAFLIQPHQMAQTFFLRQWKSSFVLCIKILRRTGEKKGKLLLIGLNICTIRLSSVHLIRERQRIRQFMP